MKYIVSDSATLSFADGSNFTLEKGIHDSKSFPDNVKKHWAFDSYARPIDESDLEKEALNEDLTAHVELLQDEVTSLTEQIGERDKTIANLQDEVTSLKAEIAAGAGKAGADNSASADGVKNAKKQQPAE